MQLKNIVLPEVDVHILFKLVKYFFLYSKSKISQAMQYRLDFLLGFFIAIFASSLAPICQYLIFVQMKGYPNWNLYQIILFQGVMLLWFGVKEILFADVKPYVESLIIYGAETEIPSHLVANLTLKSCLPKDVVTIFTRVPKESSIACSMHQSHKLGSHYKTMH